PAEEREVADADAPGDLDLVVAVHGERHHAVDVRRRQAGVVESRLHGLGRQAQLGAAGVLGELGGADAGDGRLTGQPVAVRRTHGSTSVTVPTTWSPRLLVPFRETSTTPSAFFVT